MSRFAVSGLRRLDPLQQRLFDDLDAALAQLADCLGSADSEGAARTLRVLRWLLGDGSVFVGASDSSVIAEEERKDVCVLAADGVIRAVHARWTAVSGPGWNGFLADALKKDPLRVAALVREWAGSFLDTIRPAGDPAARPGHPTREWCILPTGAVRWIGDPAPLTPRQTAVLGLLLDRLDACRRRDPASWRQTFSVPFDDVKELFPRRQDRASDKTVANLISELGQRLDMVRFPLMFHTALCSVRVS
jgi:hypothetical protein